MKICIDCGNNLLIVGQYTTGRICKTCQTQRGTRRMKALRGKGRCRCGRKLRRQKRYMFDKRTGSWSKEWERKMCSLCLKTARKNYYEVRKPNIDWGKLLPQMRESNKQKKMETFAAYGGKCSCCSEQKVEFLSIDHIDPATRDPHHRSGINLYKWLKRRDYPSGFRVLCMNCNFSIGHFGYCPHDLPAV